MEIRINPGTHIEEIPVSEFNVSQVNRIKKEYGGLRQDSKAPT